MKFLLKPSLERMTLIKVVLTLWNQNDVKMLISEFSSSDDSFVEWLKIEEKVADKVPDLKVPQLLQEKVLSFIKPIGQEILKWLNYHSDKYNLHVQLPAEFCWTSKGTIDRQRTAEVLLRDENLDIVTCYKLACIYCLEEDINKFWNKMPNQFKEESVSHEVPFCLVIRFWFLVMKRRSLRNAHIQYKDLFQESVQRSNKAAAEYFLQKLDPRERAESLIAVVEYISDAETLFFLLSVINQEQQTEIFQNNPYKVLRCFLQWPLQGFFIGAANCMWEFLSQKNYERLLKDIVIIILDGYKDYNYQNLFTEFWQESSSDLKSFITDEISDSMLFKLLLHIKDKEKIKLILKDATLTGKEKFLYSDLFTDFCKISICYNAWDFLEFCIKECCPSSELIKFKEEYESRMIHSDFFTTVLTKNKQEWDKIFCLYDNSTKRSIEEAESSSSKRLHSLHTYAQHMFNICSNSE